MKNIFIISFLLLFCLGCDREDVWDCVQKEGDKVITEIPFDSTIQILKIFDDINLVLHSSESQKLELHTGKNLVGDVEFLLDTGVLHVFNHNSCRWTRSPENVELHVYSNELNHIHKYGFGNIWSEDSIQHRLRFITYGTGKINLLLNNSSIGFQLYSLTNVTLKGQTNSLGCYVNTGRDPILNAKELIAKNVSVTHDGFNNLIVNPVERLNYRIWNSGNIIITKEPAIINEIEKIGSGQLIKKY